MKFKNYSWLRVMIIFVVVPLSISLTCCSKKSGNDSTDSNFYMVDVTYNATSPDIYTYYGTGEATFYNYGDHGRIEGSVTVGGATFDAEFEGTISGNTFTVTTTTFQVEYEFNGVTYTETITIDFNAFSILGDEVTATGDYVAVTNPGNTTESGTVTFVATKTIDLKSNSVTDL